MRVWTFSVRTLKEILRDPVNLVFGLGFPIVLLLLFSVIQSNVPVSLFEPEKITPGIACFGLSFITLFSAQLISKDRESALLQRLYTAPVSAMDFILSYTLPLIPLAAAQSAVCCIVAAFLGLRITANVILSVVFIVPISLLYIFLGLLCGSVFTSKQVGGICGGLLTNLSAWLSGIWFDLELVGGLFEKAAYILPFSHAVSLEREVFAGNYKAILSHLLFIIGWTAVIFLAASFAFGKGKKAK